MKQFGGCLAALLMSVTVQAGEAEMPTSQIDLDMNDDGIVDQITVVMTPLRNRVLVFEIRDENAVEEGHIAALVSVGPNRTSFGDIEPGDDGGFSIFAGCDICGRSVLVREYKVRHQGDALMLIGFVQSTFDRVTGEATVCDVDLGTGQAEITRHDDTQRHAIAERMIPLFGMPDSFVPQACAGVQ